MLPCMFVYEIFRLLEPGSVLYGIDAECRLALNPASFR